jgi:voltage-gated sodium channel
MKLERKEYKVEDYYNRGTFATRIATHHVFNNLTLVIIFFNVCWIGYDADQNDAPMLLEAEVQFILAEYVFTAFYTFEIVVRFMAFASKRVAFSDAWFLFDGSLVLVMLLENVVMPIANPDGGVNLGFLAVLKLFRLVRIFRIVRIIRAVPELITLIRSMSAAARSVCAVSFLLWGNVYVFAVVFRLFWVPDTLDADGNVVAEGHGYPGLFDGLRSSMFTLLEGTLSAEFPVGIRSTLMKTIYLTHLVITNTLILHMLVGLMCEIVTTVGKAQRDKQAILDARFVLRAHFDAVDEERNNRIDIFEFFQMLQKPEVPPSKHRLACDVSVLIVDFEDLMVFQQFIRVF